LTEVPHEPPAPLKPFKDLKINVTELENEPNQDEKSSPVFHPKDSNLPSPGEKAKVGFK